MPLEETDILKLITKATQAKLPGWKQTYYKRIAENLQVHTKGTLFKKIDTLFPNEHPDSKAHCVNTYEPITKGSILKGINNIIRIFSNSSFKVSASDATLDFLNAPQFDGSNFFNWFLEQWVGNAVATDPNTLIAVYPVEYLNDVEDNNYASAVRFIKSDRLLKMSADEVIFISEQESDKTCSINETAISRELFFDPEINTLNGKTNVTKTYNQTLEVKINKAVIHVFTKEYFLKFTDNGAEKYEYEYYEFDNKLTTLPVFSVGGIELFEDIFESFVQPFIPFGNLALLQHRNHRAVDLMFSYPRLSEIQVPCDASNCTDGSITVDVLVQGTPIPTEQACTRCKGSGWITAQSPYKVYLKKLETGLTDPELLKTILSTDPVSFMTPETSILDYSKESWKGYLQMAEEAIFIQQSEQTGNVKSAEAKELDREMMYSFLQNIAKVFYDRMRLVVQCFENYLNANPVECSVELPVSFAIVTESEAFDALNSILGSNTPVFVKAQQVDNFVSKFVSKSSPIIKALEILKQVDPLLYYSTGDVQSFKSNNAITVDSWTNHIYAYPVLMQLYEVDKSLFDKTDEQIKTALSDAIAVLKPQAQGTDLRTQLLTKVA